MGSFTAFGSRNADLCQTRLENELDIVLTELEKTLITGEPIKAIYPGGTRTFPFSAKTTSDAQRYRLAVDNAVVVEALSGEADEAIVARLRAVGSRLPNGNYGTFVVTASGALSYAGGTIPAVYLRLLKIDTVRGQCHSVHELGELVSAAISSRTTMLVLNGTYPSSPFIVELVLERMLAQKETTTP